MKTQRHNGTWLAIAICFFMASSVFAQMDSLKRKLEQIIQSKNATVGLSIAGIEHADSLNINAKIHFPMQSIFKFHIALAVLNQVDQGRLSLNQRIFIPKSEVLAKTWSPIRQKYPKGNITLSLAEIIQYTISQSDNIGCDILLKLIGGPTIVNKYIRSIGTKEVEIRLNEAAMHQNWKAQYKNWTTATAAVDLLKASYRGNLLSKPSHEFLWQTMAATETGKNRLKGRLPSGVLVAHKTGTSGTNEQGLIAATNDMGIITLANGSHFAISVFVSNSKENEATNEKIIADIARLAYDYFASKAY